MWGVCLYPVEFFVRRRLLFGLHKNNISMLRGATIVNIHTLLKIGVCAVFFHIILIPHYVKTGVFEFSLVEARSRFWEILLR